MYLRCEGASGGPWEPRGEVQLGELLKEPEPPGRRRHTRAGPNTGKGAASRSA